MLVTFHSNAYENITYLGDVAKHLLILMGHSATIPGAIKSKDLPQALSKLESALALNKINSLGEKNDGEQVDIALSKRAFPLISLLKSSIKNNCDVLWDY